MTDWDAKAGELLCQSRAREIAGELEVYRLTVVADIENQARRLQSAREVLTAVDQTGSLPAKKTLAALREHVMAAVKASPLILEQLSIAGDRIRELRSLLADPVDKS